MLSNSSGVTQTFDLLNRMTTYTDGTTSATYTYNPDNMRSAKTVNGTTTTHVWIGSNIALDITGSDVVSYVGNIKSDYGWYVYNANGDVVQLADGSGNVTRYYDYDPYGNQLQDADPADLNPYRYSGQYFDAESGYIYLRARYYDPAIGRFISEDPAFDGFNWYVYCANNPLMYHDPSGMFLVSLAIILSATAISMWASNAKQATAGGNGWDWHAIDTRETVLTGLKTAAGATAAVVTAGTLAPLATTTTLSSSVAIGMTSSVAGGLTSRTVEAVYNPNASASDKLGHIFNSRAMAIDGAIGGFAGAAVFGLGRLRSTIGNRGGASSSQSAAGNQNHTYSNSPIGNRYAQMNQPEAPRFQSSRHSPTTIGGRQYSGHALDRMQDRGIMPSVVDNTINYGTGVPSFGKTIHYYESGNNTSVILNDIGEVVTTFYGR